MKNFTTFLLLILSVTLFAQDKIYVHTATLENIVSSQTFATLIDHPDLNNNPNAKVIVKQQWKGVYNDNPIGMSYDSGNSKWFIINENLADIPVGAAFNILIGDDAEFIVHIATTANQGAQGPANTKIDHPLLNNENPGPWVFFTTNPIFNGNQVLNPNQYGMWFSEGRRQIYEQSESTPIPENAAFNIIIPITGNLINHLSNTSNIELNRTYIDDPVLNNNPDATFVFEHYWGAVPGTEVTIDENLGLYYDENQNKWAIFSQDISYIMPENLNFDILIAPQDILNTETNEIDINLVVSPNPTTDFITIKSNTEIEAITIYNILGQQVLNQKKISVLETKIDISQQAAGTYIVHVKTTKGTQTAKLIKD